MIASLPEGLAEEVRRALQEDVGTGDVTAALVPAQSRARAEVITREDALLCGQAWFTEVFRQLDTAIRIEWFADDGAALKANQPVCRLEGPTRPILSGERTALNFLQLLSGIATRTRAYVDAVRGTRCAVLDTRKTIPGLRAAQKYAIRCGGGQNHRMGLYDAILIKENHIATCGSVTAALREAHERAKTGTLIEIEAENLAQLREAITAGATRILLDNFTVPALKDAVAETRGRAQLEASGGFDLATVRSVAETGVDFVSVGDLTKNLRAIDFSMRIVNV